MSGCGCCGKALPCGCCEGVGIETPADVSNRPGLDALHVRIGTWQTFFDTMVARLSTVTVELTDADRGRVRLPSVAPLPPRPNEPCLDLSTAPALSAATDAADVIRPLAGLATHEVSDFSIALLDGWATVGDVLTFYQERIANEGYLRTATERRSIFELARLVGYVPRPGVASSTYLAFTMEKGFDGTIDEGVRAQSLPAPGETPQSFETSDSLAASADLNTLKLRARTRQVLPDDPTKGTIWLVGVDTKLKVNDAVLIDRTIASARLVEPYRVKSVTIDQVAKRTGIELASWPSWHYAPLPLPPPAPLSVLAAPIATARLRDAVAALLAPLPAASLAPRNARAAPADLADGFKTYSDAGVRLFGALHPAVAEKVYSAYAGAVTEMDPEFKVYALRVAAALFGASAPPQATTSSVTRTVSGTRTTTQTTTPTEWELAAADLLGTEVFLDNAYDRVAERSFVLVEPNRSSAPSAVYVAKPPAIFTRTAYGLTGKTTAIGLTNVDGTETGVDWRRAVRIDGTSMELQRSVMVYTQSEELAVDDVPETAPIDGTSFELVLDGLHQGLAAGRWLVLSGERSDLKGVTDAERVMIGKVEIVGDVADTAASKDRLVTKLTLVNRLAHSYVRSTVVLYGNVVHATHGETKVEVLGSGAPAKAPQSLALKQAPLTYVSAANETGIQSTLEVRVDGVRWHEIEHIASADPTDRVYLTRADDQAKTTVAFGDGTHGLPPSSGVENVRARYRVGLGKAGNVSARQISLLATRPLGVKAVVNPIPATGGADAESRDRARGNIPIAALAIDRLVSVMDYADFARRFAGVAKARAERAVIAGRQVVHVTIAGEDDAAITPDSDLYRNLLDAFGRNGDPSQPVVLDVRDRVVIVASAQVRIDADFSWDITEPRIRSALLRRFGFDRMQLEENVFDSQVVALVQSVPGVVGVRLQTFGGVSTRAPTGVERAPSDLADAIRDLRETYSKTGASGAALGLSPAGASARIACIVASMPETIVLKEATS